MTTRPLNPEERESINEFYMSHFKNKPTIHYVVQHTWDNERWDDVCSYDEDCLELAKKGKEEHLEYSQRMESNMKKHPEQVWPMIGMKGVRIVKRITIDKFLE